MTTEQYIDGKRYSTWRPEYKQNDIIVTNRFPDNTVKTVSNSTLMQCLYRTEPVPQ